MNDLRVVGRLNGEGDVPDEGGRLRYQIVGYVRDVRYRNLREPILPQFYVPFPSGDAVGAPRKKGGATLLVRTSVADPRSLASVLRQEVPRDVQLPEIAPFLTVIGTCQQLDGKP